MSTAAARAQVTTPGTATSLVRPTTTSGADYYIPFPFPGPSPFPYPPPVPIPAPSPEPTPPSESTPNDRAPDLTVHAWAAQLNVVDLAQYAILSAAEREVAERFRSAAARWQYIARHCWMRSILAGYLQCRPAEVPLVTGAHSKPSLAGIADLHFNLTRSGARAALVVVRSEALVRVGVDMEPVRQFDRADQIVVGMFTAREERVWRTLAPKDGGARALRFALWWTAKEAWLKAIGLGLQARLD